RLVADGAAQHGIARLEGVEHRALGRDAVDVDLHLTRDLGEGLQVRGQPPADPGRLCTSTESTAGRSRTIGCHVSPLSADAYTCPPVVPKYTPHGSRVSTAIASR